MIAHPFRRYAAPLALAAALAGCAGTVPTATSTDPAALHAAADVARQAALARQAASTSVDTGTTSASVSQATTAAPSSVVASTETASSARRPTAAIAPSAAKVPDAPEKVTVVDAAIPFGAARLAEMAAYSLRHYGTATSRLTPTMIVLHFTAGATWTSARNTFLADVVNLGELPGTCAHYVIDRDGTVYSLVRVTIRCRHTIGLNDQAIGIEMVQPAGPSGTWADQQILARPAQVGAAVALVRQLQATYGIPTSSVIGHAMANADPHFHDLLGWRNDHVDWQPADVAQFRARL